ncbi:MAG TPA: c-type cytochrome [Steroidobacteraceae bacterium]|nr:c-type cytochrome [Steroidobacteraceae bacterium]
MRPGRRPRALPGAFVLMSGLAAALPAPADAAPAQPVAAANAPAPPAATANAQAQPGAAAAPRSLNTATFPAQQRLAGDPRLIARGETLYGINCKACHGADLRGGDLGGPNLLRSAIVLGDQHGEAIIPVVRNGRVPENGGTPMPALPLTDADIRAVTAYLHSVLARQQRQGAPPAGAGPRLNILVGRPDAGRRYFRAHCAGCHSATGDLAGIASRIPDAAALQDSWVAGRAAAVAGVPAAQTPDPRRQVTVSVTLATGERLEGRLERVDDFVVSLRTDDGRYRSFTRRGVPAVIAVEVHDPLAQHRALLTQYTDRDMHDVTAYLATLK